MFRKLKSVVVFLKITIDLLRGRSILLIYNHSYDYGPNWTPLSTIIIIYDRHLARLHRRRRRSYAPTTNTASYDYHEKGNSWVSFSFPFGYRAPLSSHSDRRSSAINTNNQDQCQFQVPYNDFKLKLSAYVLQGDKKVKQRLLRQWIC